METSDSKFGKEVPVISGLKKKNIYSVPEGFFNELEKDIRWKYPRTPGRFRKLRRWLRNSFVIVVLFFIVFSSVKIVSEKKYVPVETERSFYNISDGDAGREQLVTQIP